MIRRGTVNIKFPRPPSDDRGADPRFSAEKISAEASLFCPEKHLEGVYDCFLTAS
jgi:hypothetical protein